jgi:hypothetical protein
LPRQIFRRSEKEPSAELSVSTAKLKEARRTLADPGIYLATVLKAELVTNKRRTGDISVALVLRDAESGQIFDMRPLWIDGPNAARGTMAGHNRSIIFDLLTAAGIEEGNYDTVDNTLLNNLVGRTFEVEIGVDRGAMGMTLNVVSRVDGLVEEADVVPLKTTPAA